MSSYLTAGANKFRRAREWATPTLKSSAFLERGVLTPEEFIMAGDELVYKCPTWQWESGDPRKAKKYLPADKQYLVTRNVPCPTRASALENSVATGEEMAHIDEECGGDDWLVSKLLSPEEQQRRIDEKIEQEFDMLDDDSEPMAVAIDSNVNEDKDTPKVEEVQDDMAKLEIQEEEDKEEEAVTATATEAAADEVDDEYADMEEFEDEDVIEDEAAAPTSTSANSGDNILRVRTYDLSISYDKYYQTPRVWMIGYSSSDSSQPLTGAEMFQDVMSDYANRTVTIDPHPHIAGPHASIHPCQHGAVMKTIVRNLTKSVGDEEAKAPTVEMYLFIFLKFVSSIIPTINYDFTMDVAVSTEK